MHREVAKTAIEKVVPMGTHRGVDLVHSFTTIYKFLREFPDRLSSRKHSASSIQDTSVIADLATTYAKAYSSNVLPTPPKTVPDPLVSEVLNIVFGYSGDECELIKVTHQHSMAAENCVGALLERYLDSVLSEHGWVYCAGDFVKAIDFILRDEKVGMWRALQIKNRNNSENSSSKAIRKGTDIEHWYRTIAQSGKTRWDRLPESMKRLGLSELGFVEFVRIYLAEQTR